MNNKQITVNGYTFQVESTLDDDNCYETIKKTTMEYSYDTHHYAIGLIDRNNK